MWVSKKSAPKCGFRTRLDRKGNIKSYGVMGTIKKIVQTKVSCKTTNLATQEIELKEGLLDKTLKNYKEESSFQILPWGRQPYLPT